MAIILGVISINGAIAQNKEAVLQSSQKVTYNDNITLPLSAKENAQIKEVYGVYSENDVMNRPQRLKDIKNILRNRVEVIDAGMKDLSGLPKLSEVELFNDLVSTMTRDLVFSPNDFNPLKYKFNFYSRDTTKYYWVDNTSFLIKIKPQHQQN